MVLESNIKQRICAEKEASRGGRKLWFLVRCLATEVLVLDKGRQEVERDCREVYLAVLRRMGLTNYCPLYPTSYFSMACKLSIAFIDKHL